MTLNKADQQVDGRGPGRTPESHPTSPSQREEIARIIDPKAWLLIDHQRPRFDAANPGAEAVHVEQWQSTYGDSLAKADAILSLFPEAGEVDLIKKKYSDLQATYLRDIEAAERSRDEALAIITEMQADHAENFAGKVVMSQEAFDELNALLTQAGEALEPFARAFHNASWNGPCLTEADVRQMHSDVDIQDFRRAHQARETLSLIEKEGGHA